MLFAPAKALSEPKEHRVKRTMITMLTVALTTAGMAQQPPAISLRVKRLSTVKDVQKNWETTWGSYDRDFSRAVAVDISVWNMRKTLEKVTLEILFVAKPVSGSSRWIFERVVENLDLEQAKPFHVVKISKPLEASVQNYAALGIRGETGGRIDGYIVRILQGEHLVKVEASSEPLKRIGTDQKQIDALIKAGTTE
jgi:hypothetical protein